MSGQVHAAEIRCEIAKLYRSSTGLLWRTPFLGSRLVRREVVRQYRKKFGHEPQLNPPITFNEHIIHRILFDRDPRLRTVCDKIKVKDLIRERVGQSYTVPTLGIWKTPQQITWDRWPEQFVLKSNHAWAQVRVVPPSPERDIGRLTAEAEQWLAYDYFDVSLEWGYRGIPRQLLAEPLLQSSSGGPVMESHVFTFHGHAALIRLLMGVKGTPARAQCWFDAAGRRLAIRTQAPNFDVDLEESLLTELVQVAEAVAHDFSSMRVDFYLTGDGLRIGELTPYNSGGKRVWETRQLDTALGTLWNRPLDLSAMYPWNSCANGIL